MKSRDAAPDHARAPGATWIVVPLAALATIAVLGLAVFGAPSDAPTRELTGGPLVVRADDRAGAAAVAPGREPEAAPVLPTAHAAHATGDAEAVAPITLSSASRMVPIEVYTASWCSACASAERWMDANDIAYSEIDVDRQPGARDQLLALNPRRTLPTFDVAGDVLVGFDPSRLGAAIEGAARRRVH